MITAARMAALHKAAMTGNRAWSEAEFTKLLATPGCFAVGDARAFALVRVAADEAELLTIVTHPEHRRQGLARALMETWQAAAARRGATRALLEVAEDNIAARALYDDCGYGEYARRPEYYATTGDALVDAIGMDRPLP